MIHRRLSLLSSRARNSALLIRRDRKLLWFVLGSLIAVTIAARAYDLKTLDGKVYHNADVISVSDAGITINFDSAIGGTRRQLIRFKNFPECQAKKDALKELEEQATNAAKAEAARKAEFANVPHVQVAWCRVLHTLVGDASKDQRQPKYLYMVRFTNDGGKPWTGTVTLALSNTKGNANAHSEKVTVPAGGEGFIALDLFTGPTGQSGEYGMSRWKVELDGEAFDSGKVPVDAIDGLNK